MLLEQVLAVSISESLIKFAEFSPDLSDLEVSLKFVEGKCTVDVKLASQGLTAQYVDGCFLTTYKSYESLRDCMSDDVVQDCRKWEDKVKSQGSRFGV